MKSILKWVIVLILPGSLVFALTIQDFSLEEFFKWKIIAVVIVAVVVWLAFKWRKAMRLEDNHVRIQLLDD